MEEYTQKAEIVESQPFIDEFICCICTKIAYAPVECNECEKHLCLTCHNLHKEKNQNYQCPTCRSYSLPNLTIKKKILRMRNTIKVLCKDENCGKYNQEVSLEDYLGPSHIIPCKKLEASCSLGCDTLIKSIEEAINHET